MTKPRCMQINNFKNKTLTEKNKQTQIIRKFKMRKPAVFCFVLFLRWKIEKPQRKGLLETTSKKWL